MFSDEFWETDGTSWRSCLVTSFGRWTEPAEGRVSWRVSVTVLLIGCNGVRAACRICLVWWHEGSLTCDNGKVFDNCRKYVCMCQESRYARCIALRKQLITCLMTALLARRRAVYHSATADKGWSCRHARMSQFVFWGFRILTSATVTQVSSVSIMAKEGAEIPGKWISVANRSRGFCSSQRRDRIWDQIWGPDSLLSNRHRITFPGGEAAGAWSWLPCRSEFNNTSPLSHSSSLHGAWLRARITRLSYNVYLSEVFHSNKSRDYKHVTVCHSFSHDQCYVTCGIGVSWTNKRKVELQFGVWAWSNAWPRLGNKLAGKIVVSNKWSDTGEYRVMRCFIIRNFSWFSRHE